METELKFCWYVWCDSCCL